MVYHRPPNRLVRPRHLATAFVIVNYLEPSARTIRFHSKSGWLAVERDGEILVLDFPARPPERCPASEALNQGLGRQPVELWRSRDYLAVFSTPEEVLALKPDFQQLGNWNSLGVNRTAPGDGWILCPVLRPGGGDTGRPRDRLSSLYPGPLLVTEVSQEKTDRAPNLGPRWRAVLRGRRRAGKDWWQSSDLPHGRD